MSSMSLIGSRLVLLFTAMTVPGWWILASQETGWATKITAIYKVEAGLYKVSIQRGLIHLPFTGSDSTIAKYFKPGVETTAEFQDFCCGFSASVPMFSQVCDVGRVLHSTSVAMLLCVLFGSIFMCVGASLLVLWQYDKPRENLRLWMRFFYGTAPVIFACGTLQYFFFSGALGDLPDLSDGHKSAFGPCALLSILMCTVSVIPFSVSIFYVNKTAEEALNEHLSLMHKDAREEGKLQNYMAAAGHKEEGRPTSSGGESYGQQAQEAFQPQPGQYDSTWGPGLAPAPAGPGQYDLTLRPSLAPAAVGPGNLHAVPQIVIQSPAPTTPPRFAGQPAW